MLDNVFCDVIKILHPDGFRGSLGWSSRILDDHIYKKAPHISELVH